MISKKHLTSFLTVLVVFVCALQITPTTGQGVCNRCMNSTSMEWDLCHNHPTQEECDFAENTCFTWTTPDSEKPNGAHIVKGCMATEECNAESDRNEPHCYDDVYTETPCMFCCTGDNCNESEPPYSSPLTTTTFRPGPTGRDCPLDVVGPCISHFETPHIDLQDTLGYTSNLCRGIRNASVCIDKVIQECPNLNNIPEVGMWSEMLTTISASCPEQCDEAGLTICSEELVYDLIDDVLEGHSCPEFTSKMTEKKDCTNKASGLCAQLEDKEEVHLSVVQELDIFLTRYCDTDGEVRRVKRESSSHGSGFSTCDDRKAADCLTAMADNVFEYNLEAACSDVLSGKTKQCVEENTMNCNPDVMYVFDGIQKAMESSVEPYCELTCDQDAADECLYALIKSEKCEDRTSTIKCVEESIAGCSEALQEFYREFLENILEYLHEELCEVIEITTDDPIIVEEGGTPKVIEIGVFQSPSAFCKQHKDCEVHIESEVGDMFASNACGDEVPQIVLEFNEEKMTRPASVTLTKDNWRDIHQIAVHAKMDRRNDGDQDGMMSLWLTLTIQNDTVERTHLRNIMLTAIDTHRSDVCYSLNDPDLRSFDRNSFVVLLEGYFLMYRHKDLPYEVEVIYQACWPGDRFTCTCGVTVKSGDTIFFIDRCRRTDWDELCPDGHNCVNMMTTHLRYWRRVTPGTIIISRWGDFFQVFLPHGTLVEMWVWEWIDIEIYPSPVDWEKTLGMCGFYNGDRDDDFRLPDGGMYDGDPWEANDFAEAWRIPYEESISHGIPMDPFLPPFTCEFHPNDQIRCDYDVINDLCRLDLDNAIDSAVGEDEMIQDIPVRRKRDARPPIDLDESFVPPPINRDMKDNYTAVCQEFFSLSTVVEKCQEDLGIDPSHAIDVCVTDMLASGGQQTWMLSAVDSVQRECNVKILEDPNVPVPVANGIKAASCPQQCSGQGVCNDGVCECFEPYIGETCRLNKNAVPSQVHLSHGGLCDEQSRDCRLIRVLGVDFLPGGSCYIQPVEVDEDGLSEEFDESKTNVTASSFFSRNEIHCYVDKATSAFVQVSNPGTERSPEMLLIVFHSVCFECINDDDPHCTRKPQNCIIDGKCYGEKVRNPTDYCWVCNPDTSDDSWTFGNHCEDSVGSSSWKQILKFTLFGFVVATAVVLSVTAAFCLIRYICRPKKHKTNRVDSVDLKENESKTKKCQA